MLILQTTPDPNSVVAGWIPVVLIALLAAATVLLFFSMRKQMRRIDIPPEGVPTGAEPKERSADQAGS